MLQSTIRFFFSFFFLFLSLPLCNYVNLNLSSPNHSLCIYAYASYVYLLYISKRTWIGAFIEDEIMWSKFDCFKMDRYWCWSPVLRIYFKQRDKQFFFHFWCFNYAFSRLPSFNLLMHTKSVLRIPTKSCIKYKSDVQSLYLKYRYFA